MNGYYVKLCMVCFHMLCSLLNVLVRHLWLKFLNSTLLSSVLEINWKIKMGEKLGDRLGDIKGRESVRFRTESGIVFGSDTQTQPMPQFCWTPGNEAIKSLLL